MKKRLLSFFLVLAIALYCAMSVFAVDTGVDIIDDPLSYYFQNQLLGTYKGTGVSLYCPECNYKVEYTGGTLVTCPYDGAQLLLAGKYGVKATPIDMKNAGSNVPPGGRNPKGYQNETGVPSVDSLGTLHIVVKPVFMVDEVGSSSTGMKIFKNYTFNEKEYYQCGTTGIVHGETLFNKLGQSMVSPSYVWTFEVPYSGIYYINANEESQNLGSYFLKSCNSKRKDITINVSTYHSDDAANKYWIKSFANKGDVLSFYYCDSATYLYAYTSWINYIQYSSNPLIVSFEPEEQYVSSVNNITINNNTWNGNIYVDSSNKLTYIYPQYTTINENNETVTTISNNPIIYNEETKQYYTYDSVTNNYYYITYGDPAPTPTPSPSPDPGGSGGGDNPSGGGSSGGGSGDSSSGSGSSWWEKLLDKLGSALIDGLLDAIKGILKLLFDLISSILGWIIWLCSKVFDLFPFLPPGVGALLVGGVVVCFILAFIKFIRG